MEGIALDFDCEFSRVEELMHYSDAEVEGHEVVRLQGCGVCCGDSFLGGLTVMVAAVWAKGCGLGERRFAVLLV